jgi:hypothetical protein
MHTLKTVLFGFVGVRRKADHEQAVLNPVHVALAAVVLVVGFVVTLVAIVKIVTS